MPSDRLVIYASFSFNMHGGQDDKRARMQRLANSRHFFSWFATLDAMVLQDIGQDEADSFMYAVRGLAGCDWGAGDA